MNLTGLERGDFGWGIFVHLEHGRERGSSRKVSVHFSHNIVCFMLVSLGSTFWGPSMFL